MTGNGLSRQNKIRSYATASVFPTTGQEGVWYFDTATGEAYYWDGAKYLKSSVATLVFNNQVGTTYPITASDHGKIITVTNANPIVVTLPEDSTENLDAGFWCIVRQGGAGQITFAVEGADAIESADTLTKLRTQYTSANIIKKASAVWLINGDMTA